MSSPRVPLADLAAAVQSAVQQTLAKHGAVPIDQLWVGFVAPENIANEQSAQAVANVLAKEGGVHAQPSVAQIGAGAAGAAQAKIVPHRIIGLIYEPPITKPPTLK
jgi:hypothetical protein